MKKTITTVLLTFIITLLLFGGGSNKVNIVSKPVEAQATSAKADLIALIRQDATAFLLARASYRAHKARYDALGISWVDGDFTSNNAGLTATQFTSGVGNLETLFNGFDSGGTLPAGLPTGVNRIAY